MSFYYDSFNKKLTWKFRQWVYHVSMLFQSKKSYLQWSIKKLLIYKIKYKYQYLLACIKVFRFLKLLITGYGVLFQGYQREIYFWKYIYYEQGKLSDTSKIQHKVSNFNKCIMHTYMYIALLYRKKRVFIKI